jgi:hypothetical protein
MPFEFAEFSDRWNLLFAVGGAIFSLYPLLQLDIERKYVTDDYQIFKPTNGSPLQRSISLLASFFVVLIPAADLMLDWPCQIKSFLFPDKRPAKNTATNCHMNEIERLVFMVGVASQASVWLLPMDTDTPSISIVYECTDTFSATLILGAIMSYLQRCTDTFTSLRATAMIIVAVIGQMMFTVRQSYRSDLPTYRLISQVATICVGISSMTFVSTILLCAVKYLRKNVISLLTLKALLSFHMGVPVCLIKKKHFDFDYELFTNIIPALHMTSSLMILAAGYYVNLSSKDKRIQAYVTKDYIVLIAEILILVIELRIRKNEVARSLVRH